MKTSFEQLLDIYANNKKVSEERIVLKKAVEEKKNIAYRERDDEIYKVQQKSYKKINKLEKELSDIDAKFDKKVISKQDLETKIKLRIIFDHLLTDATCSYGYGDWKKEDVYMEIDGNLFTVTVLVEKNNKKVNKFTLRFYVGFKYYYLSDYFEDILVGCYNLTERSFKTREEAEAYAEKNRNKIMSPLWSKENFLFRSVKGFEYDVLKEFDFRGVQHCRSEETLEPISKTRALFNIDYGRTNYSVEYLGDGKFIVNNGDEEFIEKLKSAIAWGKICRIPEKLIKIEVSK